MIVYAGDLGLLLSISLNCLSFPLRAIGFPSNLNLELHPVSNGSYLLLLSFANFLAHKSVLGYNLYAETALFCGQFVRGMWISLTVMQLMVGCLFFPDSCQKA